MFLRNEGEGYLLADTTPIDTLKFNVVNFQGSFDSISTIQSASMYQIDDTSNTKDLTSKF